METIIDIRELMDQDISKVGKKAIDLSNLDKLNIKIPSGFVITSQAFGNFLEQNNIASIILGKIRNLDALDSKKLEETSFSIRNLIMESTLNKRAEQDIFEAYENLDMNMDAFKDVNKEALDIIRVGKESPFVVLRSGFIFKFTNDDANIFSVKGNRNLIRAIKMCWASIFNPKTVLTIKENNFDIDKILPSVIVQKQVQPNKSGIIYSYQDKLKIEAGLGLGNLILSQKINPDEYTINKHDLRVSNIKVNSQEFYDVLDVNLGKIMQRSLGEDQKTSQKLSDYEISKLVEIYRKIEESYLEARDFEFAIEGTNIFVLQTKPLNGFKKEEVYKEEENDNTRPETTDFGDIPFID